MSDWIAPTATRTIWRAHLGCMTLNLKKQTVEVFLWRHFQDGIEIILKKNKKNEKKKFKKNYYLCRLFKKGPFRQVQH